MSTFADGGIYIKPELILSIEDKNGKIIKRLSARNERSIKRRCGLYDDRFNERSN